jgi:hypothetical protein
VQRRPALIGSVAGVIVAAIVIAALVGTDRPHQRERVAPAERFIEAWQRHRSTTWAVEGRFTRLLNSGEPALVADTFSVQRPDERLSARSGGVNALVAGQRIVCVTSPEGTTRCVGTAATKTYADEVNDELADWRTLLIGPDAVFAVTSSGNCFHLERLRGDQAFDRYGRASTMCFDHRTGALERSEIRHPAATDVFEATSIRSDVRDSDFALPAEVTLG